MLPYGKQTHTNSYRCRFLYTMNAVIMQMRRNTSDGASMKSQVVFSPMCVESASLWARAKTFRQYY